MFGFDIIKVNKIKKMAQYFKLLDFQNQKDLAELKAIINLFELDEIALKGIVRVSQDSGFLNLPQIDETVIVNIKKTFNLPLSKKKQHDIELDFYGKIIDKIIELASQEGEALYIISKNDSKDIEFILNDNDHNYINFSTLKYDVDEIRSKIKMIIKK